MPQRKRRRMHDAFRNYMLDNYQHICRLNTRDAYGKPPVSKWHIVKRVNYKRMTYPTLCGLLWGYKGGVLRNKHRIIDMVEEDMSVCEKCRDIAFSKFRKDVG